jgi:lipid II isoglutaminyl synthase (glutamine-hydrolysing)
MRFLFALWLGKFIFIISRLLKTGGGSAAPGYYALKIYPDLLPSLIRNIQTNVVITGTNGKTTTARILNHFIEKEGISILRNSTGSNLERGIVSSLINSSDLFGNISGIDLGIWELDEAAFNSVSPKIKPKIIVFLNAFRDQMDRYGEVDTVVKNWERTLNNSNWDPVIVINQGDANTCKLSEVKDINHYGFKVLNHEIFQEKVFHKEKLEKSTDFSAEIIANKGLTGSEFIVKYPKGSFRTNFHIPGIYHVYDFLAAFAAYYLLSFPVKDIEESLKSFLPAFGRVERFEINNRNGYIFLIKNPAGATQVFETIAPNIEDSDTLLLALNDNFADGKDVSWIWDAEFEKLKTGSAFKNIKIICAGLRAEELALRLKYAGFRTNDISTENNIDKAFSESAKGSRGKLFILPTYTALLELQNLMSKRGLKKHYWSTN